MRDQAKCKRVSKKRVQRRTDDRKPLPAALMPLPDAAATAMCAGAVLHAQKGSAPPPGDAIDPA